MHVSRTPVDGAPSPRFGLTLLGRFELAGPDGIVSLASGKLAGLLTYLACTSPRPRPRERLSALLWGSHFDAQAKQNLRQALSRLRKVLGHDALASDGEVVCLNGAVVGCDVRRFEALVHEGGRDALLAATDLYRGRLIDDVAISEEGWSDWLTGERERLLDLALGAMMRLGEQELAAGRPEHALTAGRRAIGLNNMREDAHRLVVQALVATGRRAEALKHYQDLVGLLQRELSTEPDAATKSLVAELRATQPPGRSPAVRSAVPALRPDGSMSADEKGADSPAAGGDGMSSVAASRSGSSERRQLSVMACNMVDSMPLSARLDPEDMRDLIVSFHKVIADEVSRFDGFIAQHLGDGALIYFGYPAAHEHEAEQAVRAGLAILDAVNRLKVASDVTLRARIGIATGVVVVGELGAGNTAQRVAIGETPNLAALLQATAAPGEVVVAASTRRLVGRLFDCRALGAEAAKGLPQSVKAWHVRGEAAGVGRFAARRAGALSPLVGRQEEIELLLRRWDQTKRGKGRVVLLSGEPGIGKSRIAEDLLLRLRDESHVSLRNFCSPHHTHSALHPFITQLEWAARFEPSSSAEAKLDKLEALLRPTATPRDVALIAELLAVPTDGRYPALAIGPQQKREMTLAVILDQLAGVAARKPVLVVFEDAHWIDPTSLDLLDRTVARIASLPVLLVVTARPEFQPSWVGQPHVTMLPLSRLNRSDSADIIGGITKGKTLPDAVVEQVLARADGVPLFVEELTSTLIESRLLRETADRYVLDGALPPIAIPMTLQASLAARLDRLGPVKHVARIGAAIGRDFSHELIAAVSTLAPADLDAALERLTASGLISRRGTPPEATYSFKHALIQASAYVTILKSRRRQLHASIAKALVERFPVIAGRLPEVVARHFTEAGLASEASGYWLKAGQLAYARWANREAVKFFEQALTALAGLPETRERLEQAIDLRFDLKKALLPLGDFGRICGYLHEAEGVARTLGDQRRLGEMSVHMCHTLWMTGRSAEALRFGQDAQALGEMLGDVPLQMSGKLYLGATCMWMGDYRQAEDLLLTVVQGLESGSSQECYGLPGFPTVAVRCCLTLMSAWRGRFKEGIVHGQEGIRLAEVLDHPYSLASACWYLGHLQTTRGEFSHAAHQHERALTLSRQWNLTFLSELSAMSLGYVHALSGRIVEGIALLEHARNASETMGAYQPLFLLRLGEAYLLADRLDEALTFVGRALALARERDQRGYEAQAARLLGDVAAHRASLEPADRHYRDALALAEELGMHPLAAHCHYGLGKLYQRSGARKRGSRHLTIAATMYRDMEMTYWLAQAETQMSHWPSILRTLQTDQDVA